MQILSNSISALKIAEILAALRKSGSRNNGVVRFKNVSGNIAASCMRNASGCNNYRNSSVIVAMGQIPRSTERIAS